MSYWSNGARSDGTDLNSWKLSLALAKKNYGEVHLVTDSNGKEFLKDLPFTSVINILDDIPKFEKIWILGKIYAYKYACQFGPFLHLDSDFYIWKAFPKAFTNSPIFAQCPDSDLYYEIDGNYIFTPQYDLLKLKNQNNGLIPEDWDKIVFEKGLNLCPINMGIFGGTDTNTINEYCNSLLTIIHDPKYKNLWECTDVDMYMVEQFHLKIFSIINNVDIKFLHGQSDEINFYQIFCHMHGLRTTEPFKSAIAKRVEKEPYDLMPKIENKEVKEFMGIVGFPV